MFDFTFFALLFLLAQTLAPAGRGIVVLENTRHPEQQMTWVRRDDGRWAMTLNERELGHFTLERDAVVHATGQRDPDRFAIADLAEREDLVRAAARIRLRGSFGGRTIEVSRDGNGTVLTDPSRELLRSPLRLRVR